MMFGHGGLIRGIGFGVILAGTWACGMEADAAGPRAQNRDFEDERAWMVKTQIEGRGVSDPRVLHAMRSVPRHEFVPESLRGEAYRDAPLPIGYDQTISQPYVVAYMTEVLKLEDGDRVLEIGTGSGYQAAILARIAREVYSVEIIEPLYQGAKETLQRLGFDNVRVRQGDGWKGWPEEAPFDKIIVTAAPEEIPEALVSQLREGGIMVIPVGPHGYQNLILGVKKNGNLEKTQTMGVRFVPLVRGRS